MKAKEHPGCRSWAHTQGQGWDRSHFLTGTSSSRQDLRGAERGGEEPSGPFEFDLRHPGFWEENTASRKGLGTLSRRA